MFRDLLSLMSLFMETREQDIIEVDVAVDDMMAMKVFKILSGLS